MKWGIGLGVAVLLCLGYLAALPPRPANTPGVAVPSETSATGPTGDATHHDPVEPPPDDPLPPPLLPHGGRHFDPDRMLVAYYGTAGTGSLGVLGERSIPVMTQRLRQAAQAFARPGRPVQIVYELIVTVADAHPGRGRDYSHDIDRAKVEAFIRAAHRNKALLVLDLQPGRAGFLEVAKRWAWALKDPWVSLALDPEWRMHGRQVPARVIGSVSATEVNRVGAWLDQLTRVNRLPDKLFVVHQFRTEMVRGIAGVADRPRLVEVQHVDGFGNRQQKLATYHHVERHEQFRMGFKLFYDEDTRLFAPWEVLRIRPAVRFVSYQ
ncbi:hypothetical protein [Nocardioides sp.]|uniref:hypothetical protein n=1 Tax=Nocardioides sp. TaxID=35761 RepID=UPI003D133F3D